jgi:hypothetical protein
MSKHYEGYDEERWRSAATYKPQNPTTSRHFIPGERVAPDSLLTVIGPGFTDRYGKKTYRDVEVLCDPQYGGCGERKTFPYALLFGYRGKYSCGCKKRRGANEGDHTGLTVTGYGTNRKLTILYFDESVNLWAYVCECCGDIGHVPRGLGLTTPMKLKVEARKVCKNSLMFVPVQALYDAKLGIQRSTKFLPKEQIEMKLANDIGAVFPQCKFEFAREMWGNRITGIKLPAEQAQALLADVESTRNKYS